MVELSLSEREALRDGFSRLLRNRSTEEHVRIAMASEPGFDRSLWQEIADMGLTGLIVPEAHGGAGASAAELAVVLEEAGAALLCAPFLASAVVAAGLLSASLDVAAKAEILPKIADGTCIATAALTGPEGTWTPQAVAVDAVRRDGDWRLSGTAAFVLYGCQADLLLVMANGPSGLIVFLVDPSQPGVVRIPEETFDVTRRMARITFSDAGCRLLEGTGAEAMDAAMDLARVALVAEQAGGARRVFDLTVEYLKTRVQFGRPIGGFQAVKHIAADLLIEVESSTTAARQAAISLAQEASTSREDIALAAFTCADVYSQIAAMAIQLHGGIAFTWEHCAHLYLRRARADTFLFGSPAWHREQFLQALEAAR